MCLQFITFRLWQQFKVTVRSYYLEAKWLNQKHVAPFEEYLANAKLSTGLYMISFATFMGLKKEDATVEACNWAKSYPKIVQALCSVGRLNNDMRDYEVWKYNYNTKPKNTILPAYTTLLD